MQTHSREQYDVSEYNIERNDCIWTSRVCRHEAVRTRAWLRQQEKQQQCCPLRARVATQDHMIDMDKQTTRGVPRYFAHYERASVHA